MKHFPVEEWIDFVSHVSRAIRRKKMKEHLQQVCKRCSKIVSLLRRVRQAAETEANYTPPGDAVRIAKTSFAGSNLAGEQKRRDSLAELLFDSFYGQHSKALDHRALEQDKCSIAQTPFRLIC